eukprot:9940982-Alexandrium_andersonii.AAC.1
MATLPLRGPRPKRRPRPTFRAGRRPSLPRGSLPAAQGRGLRQRWLARPAKATMLAQAWQGRRRAGAGGGQ